jgi:hypothetical protein
MSHLPCPAVSGMNSPHKSADFFSSSAFGLLLTIPFRTVSALVVFPGYSLVILFAKAKFLEKELVVFSIQNQVKVLLFL